MEDIVGKTVECVKEYKDYNEDTLEIRIVFTDGSVMEIRPSSHNYGQQELYVDSYWKE